MNTEELVKQALTQVPALTVLVVVVYFMTHSFLNYIEKQGSMIQQLHNEHMTARGEMRDVLKDNADAIKSLSVAIATCPLKKP